jgi:hypothetical protein
MDSLLDAHRLSDADVCGNAAQEGGGKTPLTD